MLINFYRFLVILSCFLVGYLFGSIPFSVILGKYAYHKDPRKYGSHNPGGTNVGRVIGHKAAVITILLDMIKVIIPFFVAFFLFTKNESIISFMNDGVNNLNDIHWYGRGNSLCELAYYMVALGAYFGHSYSFILKFKGGKIVSTYASTIISTTYLAFPLFGLIFFGTLKLKKYVSLASIVTAISFCIYTWIAYLIFVFTKSDEISKYFLWFGFGPQESIYLVGLSTIGTALLVFRHRSNIKRLINHEENKVTWIDKIGKKKESHSN